MIKGISHITFLVKARSLCFYDYDSHLFELHTGELEERMKYYLPQALNGL